MVKKGVMVSVMLLAASGCATVAPAGFGPPSTPAGSSTPVASVAGSPTPTPAPLRTSSDFSFPSDFKVRFPAYRGDGEAAVRAFGEFWRAWWYAISTEGRDRRYQAYLPSIDPFSGLAVFPQTVASWRGEQVRPTGVLRAHRLRVTSVVGADQVGLVVCADESRVGTRTAAGAERWTFGKRDTSRYQMRILMRRQPSGGGWQVAGYMTDASVKECR